MIEELLWRHCDELITLNELSLRQREDTPDNYCHREEKPCRQGRYIAAIG